MACYAVVVYFDHLEFFFFLTNLEGNSYSYVLVHLDSKGISNRSPKNSGVSGGVNH